MPLLSTKARLALPDSVFGLPERRAFPMPDASHARNAKARASEDFHKGHLTQAEKSRINAKADAILAQS